MRSLVAFALLPACLTLCAAESTDWISALGGKALSDRDGNVRSVNLRGSWIDDTQMIELTRMPRLERLDLSHTRISDEGLLYLKPMRGIADLNLYYAEQITDQGVTAIRNWNQLRRLSVRGTRVSDGTLEIVSHLTRLEALDIANTQTTDNGLDYLITLTSLRELTLGWRRQSDNLVEMLRLLPTLTYLDLGGPGNAERPENIDRAPGRAGAMREDLVRAIADLKDLRVLKLAYANISVDGLKVLRSLEHVERLGLEGCRKIDDAALEELAQWKSLKYVDLQDTQVTAKGLDALRKARPDLAVLAAAGSLQIFLEERAHLT